MATEFEVDLRSLGTVLVGEGDWVGIYGYFRQELIRRSYLSGGEEREIRKGQIEGKFISLGNDLCSAVFPTRFWTLPFLDWHLVSYISTYLHPPAIFCAFFITKKCLKQMPTCRQFRPFAILLLPSFLLLTSLLPSTTPLSSLLPLKLSQPATNYINDGITSRYPKAFLPKLSRPSSVPLNSPPPSEVLIIPNFLTSEECMVLIEMGERVAETGEECEEYLNARVNEEVNEKGVR